MTPTTTHDLGPMERPAIHDPECEAFVLSSLLAYTSTFEEAKEVLSPDCFHDLRNREIFMAFCNVYASGDTPSFILVGEELARSGSAVTQTDILALLQGSCTHGSLLRHALRLKELSMRRVLWETGIKLVTKGSAETEPIEEIQNEAKAAIDSLYDSTEGSRLTTLAETYTNELQQQMLVNRSLTEGQVFGTATGFKEIDLRGGLVGSTLNIIGAETSMGKTSFANALVLEAVKQGHGVAYYSMEMQPKELNARFAAMMTGIPANRILYDRMEIAEICRCDEAMGSIDASLLHFDGRSTSSLDSILMSVRSMHSKFGIKGVVVDYLQLVNAGDRSLNREQSVGRIARELKNIAKELDIWVIALSQLARDKDRPAPSMARLRDSGQIEEAADNVFLIYRVSGSRRYPEPFTEAPTNGTAMITIGKGRNTGVGSFICGFQPETTLFRPLRDNELMQLKFATPDVDPFEEDKDPF